LAPAGRGRCRARCATRPRLRQTRANRPWVARGTAFSPDLPVAAKEFTLTTKETKTKDGKVVRPMTIKLTPPEGAAKDGKAATFVGTDPGLEHVADHAGTVVGEIGGKPASGTVTEVIGAQPTPDGLVLQVSLDLSFDGDPVAWGVGTNERFVTFRWRGGDIPYEMTMRSIVPAIPANAITYVTPISEMAVSGSVAAGLDAIFRVADGLRARGGAIDRGRGRAGRQGQGGEDRKDAALHLKGPGGKPLWFRSLPVETGEFRAAFRQPSPSAASAKLT